MFIILLLLFVAKHALADWFLQPTEMSQGKRLKSFAGTQYLLNHALIHGGWTMLVVGLYGIITQSIDIVLLSILFGWADYFLHASIDSLKIWAENKSLTNDIFRTVGDQFLHGLCYLIYILILLSI